MIYKDAIVTTKSHVLSQESVEFLTKVITKESKDNFRRIHVYDGIAFCISLHRLHGENLGLPDGIYDFAAVDGGYELKKFADADVDLGEYLKATQVSLIYPVRLFGLPEINITAARSLAKNGMLAAMAYNLTKGYLRFTGFLPNPGIEASFYTDLTYVNPEYLLDAAIALGMNAESTISANKRYVQLWNRNQFAMIASVDPRFPSDMLKEFADEPSSNDSG